MRAVVEALRRRLPVLVLCAVLGPAIALALSLLQEKQYTGTAKLLFRDPALDQKLFGSSFLQPAQDPARQAATNIQLVSLDVVAAATARALDRKLTPGEVSSKTEVAGDASSDVVSVDATDESPRLAAQLANVFAQKYIDFRRAADRSKIREAQHLVQRQLTTLEPDQLSGSEGRSLRERAEQLQILASLQTGNAELVQRANVPGSPSSPRTASNVSLGAMLGLLLGIVLALLLDRLDRRLRNPGEVEAIFRRPILATVPENSTLAKIGPAREQPLAAIEEAFRMLRANLRYFNIDRDIRSVLVTSPAPGDGKTTVAWNLALAAAASGDRVLLIEADLRRPSIAASAPHVGPAPGLSTVLAGHGHLREAVQHIAIRTGSDGSASARRLDVLVAGPLPPNPVDLIESDRMREVLREAEASYELVIIDTPPTSVVSDAIPLVKAVSGVMVVARLGKTTREAAAQLRDQLDNLDAPTLGVVVNALGARRFAYGYGYGYGYGDARADDDERPANEAAIAVAPAPDDEPASAGALPRVVRRRRS